MAMLYVFLVFPHVLDALCLLLLVVFLFFISVNDSFFCVWKSSQLWFLSPFCFSCKLIIVMFGIILNFDRFTSCTRPFVCVFVCFCFPSVLFLPPKLVSSSSGLLTKRKDEPSLKPQRVSKSLVLQTRVCLLCAKHTC